MKLNHFCWLLGLLLLCLNGNIVVEEDVPKSVKRTPMSGLDDQALQILDRRRATFQPFAGTQLAPPAERSLRDSDYNSDKLSARQLVDALAGKASKSDRKLFFGLFRRRKRRNNRRRGGRRQNNRRQNNRRNPPPKGLIAQIMAQIHRRQQIQRSQPQWAPVRAPQQRQQHRRHQQTRWHRPQHRTQWRPAPSQRRAPAQRARPMTAPVAFVHQQEARLPEASTTSGATSIQPPFHEMRHDLVRFHNQVRHIQLINSDQHLVDRLWKHLHVNLARFRNESRHARRYNGIVLRRNLQNRLRNDRNMLRQSSLQMEDQIYRENRRLFRQLNSQARRFENQTLTNSTIFYDTAKERSSNFQKPDPKDLFY